MITPEDFVALAWETRRLRETIVDTAEDIASRTSIGSTSTAHVLDG